MSTIGYAFNSWGIPFPTWGAPPPHPTLSPFRPLPGPFGYGAAGYDEENLAITSAKPVRRTRTCASAVILNLSSKLVELEMTRLSAALRDKSVQGR